MTQTQNTKTHKCISCVSAHRFVAELQQLVSQSGCISNEFLQRLFQTDGLLKNLITAVHTHGVGGLGDKLKNKVLDTIIYLQKNSTKSLVTLVFLSEP